MEAPLPTTDYLIRHLLHLGLDPVVIIMPLRVCPIPPDKENQKSKTDVYQAHHNHETPLEPEHGSGAAH